MSGVKWDEIEVAKSGNRCEIVLSGPSISKKIEEGGLDPALFTLTGLNCLFLTKTGLEEIPPDLSKLTNIINLVLHSNRLKRLPAELGRLSKLKSLDVSSNVLEELPAEINALKELYSANLGSNKLSSLPDLSSNTKLAVLDLSHNNFEVFPDICHSALNHLSELRLKGNAIEVIPSNINVLSSLKIFDISENKLKTVPGQLGDLKLKDINLKLNPLSDKRLLKLVTQCKPNQILQYIQQHCPKTLPKPAENATAKDKPIPEENKEPLPSSKDEEGSAESLYSLVINPSSENELEVRMSENVLEIRPHIVCCIVRGISFTPEKFSAFIQLQSKLHETICGKRKMATIATHDMARVSEGRLTYEARPPEKLLIHPIGGSKEITGAELFNQLTKEAEDLRKEKKRKNYSGIHKFLHLLEGKTEYPCLADSSNRVISFPPLTNSDHTKMSAGSKDMLIEVTSDTSQAICRKILDTVILECLKLGLGVPKGSKEELTIEKVRVTLNDKLKTVYPSKLDLEFAELEKVSMIREK